MPRRGAISTDPNTEAKQRDMAEGAAAVSAGMQVLKSGSAIIFGNLNSKLKKDKDLRRALVINKEWIMTEMELLTLQVGAGHGLSEEENDRSEAWHVWAQKIRELKYEIEDCIVSYEGRVTCKSGAPWYRRKLHPAMTLPTRTRYAKKIAEFRVRVSRLVQQRDDHVQSTAAVNAAPATRQATIYTKRKNIEGIGKSKNALLELLDLQAFVKGQPEILEVVQVKSEIVEVAEGQPEVVEREAVDQKLKVVSVVGFAGLGKTTLVESVFHSNDITQRFPRRAWVVASSHEKTRDLLVEIINQLNLAETIKPNSLQPQDILAEELNTCLQNGPSFFVVIDDLTTEVQEWDAIKSAFPTEGADGRIIVTTRIQSMATSCSSNGGCVHQMQALDMTDSEALFLKEVFGDTCTSCTPDFEIGLKHILKTCEGWPLALLDIAQLVKRFHGTPTGADCRSICSELGSHLDCHQTRELARTRQVIVDSFRFNFNKKDDERLRTCLLYASIYQKLDRTKWKSLLRRLSAEGNSVTPTQFEDLLAKGEDSVTRQQIEELFNRCIIHRRDIRQNCKVKTYQIGPVLLEFMVCKQACRNFITLIQNGERQPYCGKKGSVVRQLYLSGNTAGTGEKDSLSSIRSLTISGHDGDELVDFDKCKMLRVLDVEQCKQVKDTDLQKICKLFYLNYLNLRGTNVKTLPRKAAKLHYLQILDMRETDADIELPMEVLILGQLVHLFGRFKLPPELSKVGAGHAVMRKSKLKTFAGFILDDCKGFQHIMSDIKTLMKVKIWSGTESSQGKDLVECLVPSLQKRFTEDSVLESLSIDFGNDSIDFLNSLQGPCALESIKLHGKLTGLPGFFFEDVFAVQELQLSKTGLSCKVLSALQNLNRLLYLKLHEDSPIVADPADPDAVKNDIFTFSPSGFKSLKGLCFQTPKLPKMDIKKLRVDVHVQRGDMAAATAGGARMVVRLMALHASVADLAGSIDSVASAPSPAILSPAPPPHRCWSDVGAKALCANRWRRDLPVLRCSSLQLTFAAAPRQIHRCHGYLALRVNPRATPLVDPSWTRNRGPRGRGCPSQSRSTRSTSAWGPLVSASPYVVAGNAERQTALATTLTNSLRIVSSHVWHGGVRVRGHGSTRRVAPASHGGPSRPGVWRACDQISPWRRLDGGGSNGGANGCWWDLPYCSSDAKLMTCMFSIFFHLVVHEFWIFLSEIYKLAQDAPDFLDRMGFGRAHPCICPCGFKWARHGALLFVDTMEHVYFKISMVLREAENVMTAVIGGSEETTKSSSLDKWGRQRRRTLVLVALLEYRVSILWVKPKDLICGAGAVFGGG
ncbi:disease resistance protein RGA4 [Aegilops tauschii subsp. strangulata]|uniref:disease resistance protein RGA4 n=1 Tax=Aegilops tauschii subsp. strangulata TaxID=200361 RepID=UPI003CC85B5F